MFDKRPPSMDTVRGVLETGPVKLRFKEDTKTMVLDSFTASAMVACYNALSIDNQAKVDAVIVTKRGFMKFVNLCWKYVS